jgi:hypothetical protein
VKQTGGCSTKPLAHSHHEGPSPWPRQCCTEHREHWARETKRPRPQCHAGERNTTQLVIDFHKTLDTAVGHVASTWETCTPILGFIDSESTQPSQMVPSCADLATGSTWIRPVTAAVNMGDDAGHGILAQRSPLVRPTSRSCMRTRHRVQHFGIVGGGPAVPGAGRAWDTDTRPAPSRRQSQSCHH